MTYIFLTFLAFFSVIIFFIKSYSISYFSLDFFDNKSSCIPLTTSKTISSELDTIFEIFVEERLQPEMNKLSIKRNLGNGKCAYSTYSNNLILRKFNLNMYKFSKYKNVENAISSFGEKGGNNTTSLAMQIILELL
jgi:hypothetical protein